LDGGNQEYIPGHGYAWRTESKTADDNMDKSDAPIKEPKQRSLCTFINRHRP